MVDAGPGSPDLSDGRDLPHAPGVAHGAPSPRPVDPEVVLQFIPIVLTLVEADGTIRWINELVAEIGGWSAAEMIGTNMLEYVDATWNPQSLESIGYAMSTPGRRLPAVMRMKTKDGGFVVIEATADNQLENPDLNALVAVLRPCDEQQLLDQILESSASGDELEITLSLLHPVGWSDTMRSDSAVVLLAPDGAPPTVLASSPVVEELVSSVHPGAPWSRAAASGGLEWAGVSELPPQLAGRADAAGFEACWAYPVPRTGDDGVAAVLVFFRREPGPPEPSAVMLGDRLVRITGLVLERSEYARHLRYAAEHDHLTGLANRSAFFAAVDDALRGPDGVGVLYMDLDGFKPINDRFGHTHGDEVLRRIAGRLEALARPGDVVGRLGGDEFAIACPGASVRDLVAIAERLLEVLPRPIQVDDVLHQVGTTIGLAAAAPGSVSADVLVAAADTALVAAKVTDKGTWRMAPSPDGG